MKGFVRSGAACPLSLWSANLPHWLAGSRRGAPEQEKFTNKSRKWEHLHQC